MIALWRFAILTLLALAWPTEAAPQLTLDAEQIRLVLSAYQRDHYCPAYPLTGAVRTPGQPRSRSGQSLIGMWTAEARLCDPGQQQNAFYDSVWRDALRLEAIINYKAYFGLSVAGRLPPAALAVDDGVVTGPMMKLLTTDTTATFGAQNDDILWWALAFLRGYQANSAHTAYLRAAKAVFARIEATPEQAVCGGGVTWGAGTHYKNAITNALYLRLATDLAAVSGAHSSERRHYLAAARTQADWLIDRSNLWIAGGLLADGVHFAGETCDDKPEATVWTYSQGVAISGLAQLTLLTGETRYADRAQMLLLRMLDPSQTPPMVDRQGILKESSTSPAAANEDAQCFKGIFAENVGYALPYFKQADQQRYAAALKAGRSFLIQNADAVWSTRRLHGGTIEFGFDWTDAMAAPDDPANLRTTAAAIDLFNAAWSVEHSR